MRWGVVTRSSLTVWKHGIYSLFLKVGKLSYRPNLKSTVTDKRHTGWKMFKKNENRPITIKIKDHSTGNCYLWYAFQQVVCFDFTISFYLDHVPPIFPHSIIGLSLSGTFFLKSEHLLSLSLLQRLAIANQKNAKNQQRSYRQVLQHFVKITLSYLEEKLFFFVGNWECLWYPT